MQIDRFRYTLHTHTQTLKKSSKITIDKKNIRFFRSLALVDTTHGSIQKFDSAERGRTRATNDFDLYVT